MQLNHGYCWSTPRRLADIRTPKNANKRKNNQTHTRKLCMYLYPHIRSDAFLTVTQS